MPFIFLLHLHQNDDRECDLFIITYVMPNMLPSQQEAFYNYLLI